MCDSIIHNKKNLELSYFYTILLSCCPRPINNQKKYSHSCITYYKMIAKPLALQDNSNSFC